MYPQTDIFSQLAKDSQKAEALNPWLGVAKQGWLALGVTLGEGQWDPGSQVESRKLQHRVKRTCLLIFKSLCVWGSVHSPACQWMLTEAHAAQPQAYSQGWGVFALAVSLMLSVTVFSSVSTLPQLSSARCFKISLWHVQSFCTWVKWLVSAGFIIIFFIDEVGKVRLFACCTSLRQKLIFTLLVLISENTFTSTSGRKEISKCLFYIRNPEVDLFDHIFF